MYKGRNLVNERGAHNATGSSRLSNSLFRALYLRREYAIISRVEEIKTRFAPNSFLTCSECESSTAEISDSIPSSEVILLPPYDTSGKAISRLYMEGEQEENVSALRGDTGEPESLVSSAGLSSSFTSSIHRFLCSQGSQPQVAVSNPGWHGLVSVTDQRSPWCGGLFAFTVFFPDRYPFDAPIIQMVGHWSSHPFFHSKPYVYHQTEHHISSSSGRTNAVGKKKISVGKTETTDQQETQVDISNTLLAAVKSSSDQTIPSKSPGVTLFDEEDNDEINVNSFPQFIPFDTTHIKIDSMRFSVMSQVLKHVYDVFSPERWSFPFLQRVSGGRYTTAEDVLADINHTLAHRDLERCSLTQEVILGKPYVDYLNSAVFHQFLTQINNSPIKTTCHKEPNVEDDNIVNQKDKWIMWYGREFLPTSLKLP